MLVETDIFGETRDKVQISIDRIREFEPPEGYWGATSFGKDSIVLMQLGIEANVEIEWHHCLTTIDPPELIRFGKQNFPYVKIDKPATPLLKLLTTKGFPTSQNRWCCEEYKEKAAKNRRILLGVRWEESGPRRTRKMVEACYKDPTKTYVNPIIDWSEREVWEFIKTRGLPYCSLYDEGFKRLGCIMCPKASLKHRLAEAERWPGMAAAWKRHFVKLYENKKERKGLSRWKSGEEMFDWWLYLDQPKKEDEAQTIMFDRPPLQETLT